MVGCSTRGQRSTPLPLSLALHAALAVASLETGAPDYDHAHSTRPTPDPKSHWSPASARPCHMRPHALIGESNCRSQHCGARLSLGPQAPPVALKLEKRVPAEGAKRPLQGKGSLGWSVRSLPAGSLHPPGRTCSADPAARFSHPACGHRPAR